MATDHRQLEDQIRDLASLYEIESYAGDPKVWKTNERFLDMISANISLARGRLLHERFLRSGADNSQELSLFKHAAEIYHRLGNVRGEGEALFQIGTFDQVVLHDYASASKSLVRARELAVNSGDRLTLSCIERHLGFIDVTMGSTIDARRHLEESVRLRSEIGFQSGVAAARVALAELNIENGDVQNAQKLLDQAFSLAGISKGVKQLVEQVRSQVK